MEEGKEAEVTTPFYHILLYSIIFYSILYNYIPFYSILFYSILFYSILFYSILFYSILFYSILLYSLLFHSFLFYSNPFHFILSCAVQSYPILSLPNPFAPCSILSHLNLTIPQISFPFIMQIKVTRTIHILYEPGFQFPRLVLYLQVTLRGPRSPPTLSVSSLVPPQSLAPDSQLCRRRSQLKCAYLQTTGHREPEKYKEKRLDGTVSRALKFTR